jgi:hypothetical protein
VTGPNLGNYSSKIKSASELFEIVGSRLRENKV